MVSTLAGWARALFSDARAAAVTCAISQAGVEATLLEGRNGGQPESARVQEPIGSASR